jgi:hypothetical protein
MRDWRRKGNIETKTARLEGFGFDVSELRTREIGRNFELDLL